MRLPYEATFLSDWHIGTGAGRAGVSDATVRRDVNGWVVLPGKSVTGVWRDAAEECATAFDRDGRDGVTGHFWRDLVTVVFGSQPSQSPAPSGGAPGAAPLPAAGGITSGLLTPALQALLRDYPRLTAVLTHEVPGVKVGARGTVAPGMYRQEEFARAGATLAGHLTLDPLLVESGLLPAAAGLCCVAAHWCDDAGKHRRRGAGKVWLRLGLDELAGLPFHDAESALAWLDRFQPGDAELQALDAVRSSLGRTQFATGRAPAGNRAVATRWRRWRVTVAAESPLVAEERLQGNLVRTLDYLPGSLLVPRLLGVLHRAGSGAAGAVDVHAALRRGDLVVTDATLLVGGARGVRVPRVLVHGKGEGGLADGGASVRNRLADDTRADGPMKVHRRGYVGTAEAACPPFGTVDVRSTFHAVIEDAVQRPTAAVGGLFGFEAIRAGTRLALDVVMAEPVAAGLDEAAWTRALLEAPWGVGRAKKDEYGALQVLQVTPLPEALAEPDEAFGRAARADETADGVDVSTAHPDLREAIRTGRALVLWLTSTLLVRDARLRPSAALHDVAAALERRLGAWLPEGEAETLRIVPWREEGEALSFSALERRESWQARWQRPRPSLLGLGAGSVLVLEVQGATIPEELRCRLQWLGFGERTGEGFGQVLVNDPRCLERYAGRGAATQPPEDAPPAERVSPDPSDSYTMALFRAAWRQEMHRAVHSGKATASLVAALTGVWSKRQLGVLRALSRGFGTPAGRQLAAAWFANVGRKATRKGWSPRALAALEALLTEPDAEGRAPLWGEQHFAIPADLIPEGPAAAVLRRDLWTEGVQALLTVAARRSAGARPVGANGGTNGA